MGLIINFFTSKIQKRASFFKKNLSLLRGYKKLRSHNLLHRISYTHDQLIKTPLIKTGEKFSYRFFGASSHQAAWVIQEYLFNKTINPSLNKCLITSFGKKNKKIIFPLPKPWRVKIKSIGWNLSENMSNLLWHAFLIKNLISGTIYILTMLKNGFLQRYKVDKNKKASFVYFDGMNIYTLPILKNKKCYDLISWYSKKPWREKKIDFIGHNLKKNSNKACNNYRLSFHDPLAPLSSIKKNTQLLCWGCWAVCFSLKEYLRGRWWNLLMLRPATESFIVKNQSICAKDYLFHNSNPRRPLWTYETEKKGAKATLYFYSTNNEFFKKNNGYRPPPSFWRSMNWTRYLVWNNSQKEFLKRTGVASKKIKVVGPIWFADSGEPLPELPKKTIAVFDIQPRRMLSYVQLGLPQEYYIPEIAIQFLYDIQETARQYGWTVAWKEKRRLRPCQQKEIDPKYNFFVNQLVKEKKIVSIPADTSPIRLIQKSPMVISAVFTSTGILAKHFNKKSYFYDPTKNILKNDRASHGVPLISGKTELQNVLSQAHIK